jgi:hypothetical protein
MDLRPVGDHSTLAVEGTTLPFSGTSGMWRRSQSTPAVTAHVTAAAE